MIRCSLVLILLSLSGGQACDEGTPPSTDPVRSLLHLPDHFETPAVPDFNPLSAAKIELGRFLFYETRLSGNETQSCGSCHEQDKAFADGKKTPKGSTGTTLVRNSQALFNIGYYTSLTWASDGLLELEDQLHVPIRGDNPVELGVSDGNRDEVLARFDADPMYVAMFQAAFPENTSGATINKIVFALSSFIRSLISGSSPYDRYLQGDKSALSAQQRRGLALFNGERFECFHCHTGTQLSGSYRDENTPELAVQVRFFNNGLYNVDGEGSYPSHDQGLHDLTQRPSDRGLFRAPSLRNIALTGPYMHDGSLETLTDVIRHYAAGGTVIESGSFAGDGRVSPLKSGLIRGFKLTESELADILAFLDSLTDTAFISNPAHADPFLP